jgi:hypothetical protein
MPVRDDFFNQESCPSSCEDADVLSHDEDEPYVILPCNEDFKSAELTVYVVDWEPENRANEREVSKMGDALGQPLSLLQIGYNAYVDTWVGVFGDIHLYPTFFLGTPGGLYRLVGDLSTKVEMIKTILE